MATEKARSTSLLSSTHGRKLNSLNQYPESLDLRLKYTDCDSIRMIRIQEERGSCWALATIDALSDRCCLAMSTRYSIEQKFFSAQDVLKCWAQYSASHVN